MTAWMTALQLEGPNIILLGGVSKRVGARALRCLSEVMTADNEHVAWTNAVNISCDGIHMGPGG